MEELVREEIGSFVATSTENCFPDGEPYFAAPLVGFAAANDPLFADYKRIIGPFHLAPAEFLAGAATVICWVLPISRPTRESNRRQQHWPSREWSMTRTYGEQFNVALRRHLVAWLTGRGQRAVAPQLARNGGPSTTVGPGSPPRGPSVMPPMPPASAPSASMMP